MKKFKHYIAIILIILLGTACSQSNDEVSSDVQADLFENEYLTAEIPEGWYVSDPIFKEGNWLYLQKDELGALSITVYNIQYFLEVPNEQTIKEYSSSELLEGTLNSIVADVEKPELSPWSNINILQEVESIDFKGLDAVQAVYSVDELVQDSPPQSRKLKRLLIVTDDDIVNIVFASPTEDFDEVVVDFEEFLTSLNLK